jgi:parvulin-like peptidyl-prolyl isomerase
MKKTAIISVLLVLGTLAFAQLPGTVAVVTVSGETQLITQSDFEAKVSQLSQATRKEFTRDEKKSVLDIMINDILILNAAKSMGMSVSDAQILQVAKQQVGAQMSDAQFKQVDCQQTGMSWEEYAQEAKNTMIKQQYIINSGNVDQSKVNITEQQVQEYYQLKKSEFINPDLSRFSHILFQTKNNTKPESEVLADAENVLAQIKNGSLTFAEAARNFSQDPNSAQNSGDMGFIPMNDPRVLGLFGSSFISAVFSLPKGEVSSVLKSNVGYHIIRVTDRIDQKFLTLDDPIFPGQNVTVRDFIKQQLGSVMSQAVLKEAIDKTTTALRAEATILNFFDTMYPAQ